MSNPSYAKATEGRQETRKKEEETFVALLAKNTNHRTLARAKVRGETSMGYFWSKGP